MVTVGTAVITTVAVAVTAGHPPECRCSVKVTVYVPAVLVDGVMAPVAGLIDNPAGAAVYVPPVASASAG